MYPSKYQIMIKGHLDDSWPDLFEGLSVSNSAGGNAVLTGPLPDQAALYGVLKRIGNLGLTLVSVNPILEEKTNREEQEP